MKRVTGIGGIFFKAEDDPALQEWYKRHLGIDVQAWVARPSAGPTKANDQTDAARPWNRTLPVVVLLAS
jgi:hypothetical protein